MGARGMRPRGKRRILEQPARHRRVPAWLALLAAAALGLALGSGAREGWPRALGPGPLALERISVAGARRVPAAELASAAALAPGTPFAGLDRAAVAARVAAHPWIATARVTTLAPDVLLLQVREREPAALAWLGRPPAPWLVDRAGTPFAPARGDEGYPRLVGVAEFTRDEPHPRLAQGVRLVEALVARNLPLPREIRVGGDDPHVLPAFSMPTPEGEKRVWVGGEGDPGAKLERLKRLLREVRPETAAARVIDVRFGEQVLLRGGPPSQEGGTAQARGGAAVPSDGRSG